MNDEDELIACLLAVHRRLVENEPKFEDEDVVSPQLVPTHFSPLRSKEEDDGVVFPNADGGGFAGNGAGAEMSPATKRPADLVPGPLSLTAQMNLFDPRQIIKSRKAAAELIKLVRRLHLTRPEPNHQPQPAAISATAGPSRQLNCFTPPPANHGASSAPSSPAMARVGMVDDDSVRASVLNHPRYVYLLDQIVQSLAVYCNESIHLQQAVAERGNVQMLCSIGLAGRMLENRGLMPQGRSLDEVARLGKWLEEHGVPPPLRDNITDTFALELLIDACLPPAVCSSRFDGLLSLLCDRKSKLIVEICASRTFLPTLMKGVHMGSVANLMSMGLHALPKTRAKLYDKMVVEGALRQLKDKIAQVAAIRSALAANDIQILELARALDILLLITVPNMSTIEGSDDPSSASSSHRARHVRCIAWGTNAAEVDAICRSLLRIVEYRRAILPPAVKSKIVDFFSNVMEFSATLFAVVVEVVDDVLDQVFCQCTSDLLPIVASIVASCHATAHSETINNWFGILLTHLPPREHGSRRRLTSCVFSGGAPCGGATLRPPTPPRRLTRSEELELSEYLSFASQLAQRDPPWKGGTERLFAKLSALAFEIMITHRRRPNLVFGIASSFYDLSKPLVEKIEETKSLRKQRIMSSHRKRSRSLSAEKRGDVAAGSEATLSSATPVIAAPSPRTPQALSSPLADTLPDFAPTPSTFVATPSSMRELPSSSADGKTVPRISIPGGSPQFFDARSCSPTDEGASNSGASPPMGVVPWRDKFSLRVLLDPLIRRLSE